MKFPNKCPYCGKDIVPNTTLEEYEAYGLNPLKLEIHRCIHCRKAIFVIRQSHYEQGTQHDDAYVYIYPVSTVVSFPQRLKDLSPNAYDIYSQVSKAKSCGCTSLVRGGIRISLEYLLYDYLVTFKKYDEKTVTKMVLAERCNEYCQDKQNDKYSHGIIETCTRLVRLVGNEIIHGKKALPIDTQEVEEAFELLCQYIDVELQMDSLNNRLPPKTTP